MNSVILSQVNTIEGWKTALKNLHWNASSLSQHKQLDDVASDISDFQDLISEVEQGISGNLADNKLRGVRYKITNLMKFLKDVIGSTIAFHKSLKGMGDKYVGLLSETETFLVKMQRNVYLLKFTLKESKTSKKTISERKNSKLESIIDEEIRRASK